MDRDIDEDELKRELEKLERVNLDIKIIDVGPSTRPSAGPSVIKLLK